MIQAVRKDIDLPPPACGAQADRSTDPRKSGPDGLVAGFDDVDGLAAEALRILDGPGFARELGEAGTRMVDDRYSVDTVLPRIRALYEEVAASR